MTQKRRQNSVNPLTVKGMEIVVWIFDTYGTYMEIMEYLAFFITFHLQNCFLTKIFYQNCQASLLLAVVSIKG